MDGKETTHSRIVGSKSWSQVKEASENCTTLSVEQKPPLLVRCRSPHVCLSFLSPHMSLCASSCRTRDDLCQGLAPHQQEENKSSWVRPDLAWSPKPVLDLASRPSVTSSPGINSISIDTSSHSPPWIPDPLRSGCGCPPVHKLSEPALPLLPPTFPAPRAWLHPDFCSLDPLQVSSEQLA